MTKNRETNRLIHEKSPYLLQHAHNPVDWFPWGEEAFQKAQKEDKPVFLSIGYSTCHWCHVMAHESFEDNDVAQALNKDFVSIKVDKEERPDIDAVYMTVCQAVTGRGGWPLTIIMSPNQKPFFAGTYFPKTKHYQIPGLLDILSAVTEEWKKNRRDLEETGDKIIQALNKAEGEEKGIHWDTEAGFAARRMVTEAKELFQSSFDEKYGGFGESPKFPSPHNLMFLLRCYKLEKDESALYMVEKTLRYMYRGGIFDHIGFGFSRYSTDNKWLVPHFEKMLYDNALLAIIYLETFQITEKEIYRMIAAKTLDYILREMTDSEGGFYSAQDADSEGIEGKYYVFDPAETIRLLGEEDGAYFNEYFDISERPNFEEGSIPNLIKNELYEQNDSKIDDLIKKVYEYRLTRTMLHKDDKQLTSWNSLMIVAFAKAYKALNDDKYLQAAEKAAAFISNSLSKENGKLFVRYREGEAAGDGTLDDYAFFIWALLEIYEANYNSNYLDQAIKLSKIMQKQFWDEKSGGFFLTDKDAEGLIYRPKETYDGAVPSGNSAACYVLIKLSKLTGMQEPKELANKQLGFLMKHVAGYPAGHSFALMAFMMEYYTESFLCENGVCS
ncbi:thioredoxin domain-containing protein [Sinanaerobacter chloroacetimidivorans]|uniref:Thioredoxin domain-containing protein n=1 Tax=Sinanaerobacter chloroacetimidivorans TaxID=2818044 RepID=A0A8J8B0A1_9FIRM|nr:thioredoxin domain-containing protein [Sinanaerobacter chloroacetimidivorans]MBR0596979.1 thioredoxin domain-containing protein [Sinanaerobacter chloroacetimidivorans]